MKSLQRATARPKAEWTTPILEIADMSEATRSPDTLFGLGLSDFNGNGIPDICEPGGSNFGTPSCSPS